MAGSRQLHISTETHCILALKRILPSVLISLGRESEERGDIEAAGLYAQMTKYNFLATLLLLCDIL